MSFICLFWFNQTNSCCNPTEFRLIMPACLTGLSQAWEFVMLWQLLLGSIIISLVFYYAQSIMILPSSKPVVINKGWCCIIPPLLQGHLAVSGDIFGCCIWVEGSGIWLAADRHYAKHPSMHRIAPQERIMWSKMSIVPSLRNAAINVCDTYLYHSFSM